MTSMSIWPVARDTGDDVVADAPREPLHPYRGTARGSPKYGNTLVSKNQVTALI
jgi:hypothetical protein